MSAYSQQYDRAQSDGVLEAPNSTTAQRYPKGVFNSGVREDLMLEAGTLSYKCRFYEL